MSSSLLRSNSLVVSLNNPISATTLSILLLPLFDTGIGDIGDITSTGGNSFNSIRSNVRSTIIVPSLSPSFLLRVENLDVGILLGRELMRMCLLVETLEFDCEEPAGVSEGYEKFWKSFGRERVAKGRRAESDEQIIAVPTSTTDQLRELTVWSG
jgi:hypothetical protein